MPIILAAGRQKQKGRELHSKFQGSVSYITRLGSTKTRADWGVAQLGKHEPWKDEDLSSTPRHGGKSFKV